MYSLDVNKQSLRTTYVNWRRAAFKAWMEALLSPMATVNAALLLWITARRIELTYNGQTIHMERMLNDIFDPTLRRIRIIHEEELLDYDYFVEEIQPPDYDYFSDESAPDRYNYFSFEYDVSDIDGFQVNVPTELAGLEDQIRGRILRYRLATIEYEIEYT